MGTKSALRNTYGAQRKALSPEQRQEQSIAIANQCLKLPVWSGQYYHLFLQSDPQAEVDTEPLLTILQSKDKEVVVPKILDATQLTHYLLTDSTPLRVNRWGIPEPQSGLEVSPTLLDVVFVPLFIFDLHGQRVGYGKGYYDRFLVQCKKEVIKIGLSFFEPVATIEDLNPYDIPLDYGVTPNGTFTFLAK